MQKDFHFYLTYALARKVGLCADDAEKIAWANQYTDEMTAPDLYGLQTQSAILGNWSDRQIQSSVLVPFHFVPGDDGWVVKANSQRARGLVDAAVKDILQFGIALHGLQDTFSHQGFSGWDEKLNACYPWWYMQSGLPNIGHAELGVIPDVVNYIWTDPRTGEQIDNKVRAMSCAAATYSCLYQLAGSPKQWPQIQDELEVIFRMNYDDRKSQLRNLADVPRYRNLNSDKYQKKFIEATRNHLGQVMISL